MRPYIVWSPEYSNFSGGIRALHVLNDELNKRGSKSGLHYQTSFDSDAIVLYPEIVTDNPLASNQVCRWLLNFGENKDLTFEWIDGLGGDYVLAVNIIDLNIFYPRNKKRSGVGYWVGKGSVNSEYMVDGAELIRKFEPSNRKDLAEQLSSYEYIISFDPYSAITLEATLLGTPVFIVPSLTWSENKLKSTGWPTQGYFWKTEDLESAKIQVENQFEAYEKLCKKFDDSVDNFIEISQKQYG
jgi:hypothetical protein